MGKIFLNLLLEANLRTLKGIKNFEKRFKHDFNGKIVSVFKLSFY